MRKSLFNFLSSIGLRKVENIDSYIDSSKEYVDLENRSIDKIVQHKEFLKTLADDENSRLSSLENKTSQLISQTSLIISLISLFIPLLISNANNLNNFLKIYFVLLIISTYIFYIFTILNALKNYNIKKYNYSSPSPENVLNFKNKSIEDFNEEIIRDYLFSINKNQEINNIKATNILHSYNCFKIANILLSILVILICLVTIFH